MSRTEQFVILFFRKYFPVTKVRSSMCVCVPSDSSRDLSASSIPCPPQERGAENWGLNSPGKQEKAQQNHVLSPSLSYMYWTCVTHKILTRESWRLEKTLYSLRKMGSKCLTKGVQNTRSVLYFLLYPLTSYFLQNFMNSAFLKPFKKQKIKAICTIR